MRWAAVAMLAAAVGLTAACTTSPTPVLTPVPAPSPSPSAAAAPPPVPSAPDGFVLLSDVDPSIRQDIRYATDHNFVGRTIDGYDDGVCILTREAAQALSRVQAAALAEGYSLKVYDCYRPARAGEDFVAWRSDASAQMRAEFYPNLTKPQLFSQGYVGGGATSHSSGSTVDLTLVRLPAAPQRAYVDGEPLVSCLDADRFPDNTVDMGTGFDCFDTRSNTLDARVTGVPLANRLLLRRLMSAQGFVNYSKEWWHYDLAGDPFHGEFFDFPNAVAALRPL